MPAHVRAGVFAVGVINTVFIWLDWYSFPAQWWSFFPVRIGLNFALVVCFACADRFPVASARGLAIFTGLMLVGVILGTGADTTAYYAGLLLFFTAMPVLLPLAPLEAAAIGLPFFVVYLLAAFGGGGSGDHERTVVHSLFLAGGMLTGILHARLSDRNRFQDFQRRLEVEHARDELAQLDRQKSRFTANVHHELRTPLTLTLAPLEGILAGDFGEVPDDLRTYLETMHANALRLLKLINNLLDLAKLEGQQFDLRRRTLRLDKICQDIVDRARPLAERKDVRLETDFNKDLPKVNLDPDALEQVVTNLIGNALKFTEPGDGIVVRLQGNNAGVHAVVADTGAGIPEGQLERIFDRFAQVDASSTRQHEGTGIGLSLVKELIQLHGGAVWAQSGGVGCGAEFHFTLPKGEPDEEAAAEVLQLEDGRSLAALEAFDAVTPTPTRGGESSDSYRLVEIEQNVRRHEAEDRDGEHFRPSYAPLGSDAPEIVVADDNPDMRRLFESLLSREYRLRIAKNGNEALEFVRDRLPDCVLTDVMMPFMSGTELCRILKSDPETEGVPVVLVTSKAEREMKIQGLELGADDYITKPFHPRELLARVRGLVRLHRLQAEVADQNVRLENAMSELRETEVQLVQAARLAAVGELAAGIAHEANNPLNFALNAILTLGSFANEIRQVASMIATVDFDDADRVRHDITRIQKFHKEQDIVGTADDVDEVIGIVTEGLERTQRLVADLRDFAAPERRVYVPVDLAVGLRSTIALFRRGTFSKRIRVETRLEPKLRAVQGDAAALNQVFLNLLKNAGEALGWTNGTIRVEAREERSAVVVEVHDDGPGVPEEIQERLFEPFVTSKEAGRGTGLGLSICRQIVQAHGGGIELVPNESSGTCIRIRFPIRSDEVMKT